MAFKLVCQGRGGAEQEVKQLKECKGQGAFRAAGCLRGRAVAC